MFSLSYRLSYWILFRFSVCEGDISMNISELSNQQCFLSMFILEFYCVPHSYLTLWCDACRCYDCGCEIVSNSHRKLHECVEFIKRLEEVPANCKKSEWQFYGPIVIIILWRLMTLWQITLSGNEIITLRVHIFRKKCHVCLVNTFEHKLNIPSAVWCSACGRQIYPKFTKGFNNWCLS